MTLLKIDYFVYFYNIYFYNYILNFSIFVLYLTKNNLNYENCNDSFWDKYVK